MVPVIQFRPDSAQLAVFDKRPGAAWSRQAVVWDLPGLQQKLFRHPTVPDEMGWVRGGAPPAFLPDGRLLFVQPVRRDKQERLVVRDLVSGQEVGPGVVTVLSPMLGGPGVGATRLSADGRLLLGLPFPGHPDREPLQIWNVTSGVKLAELRPPDDEGSRMTLSAGFSPDNKWLYQLLLPFGSVTGRVSDEMRLSVWSVASGRRAWQVRGSGAPSLAAFSPDSNSLATGDGMTGAIDLWDVATGEQLFRWEPPGAQPVQHLAFTPDGAFLAFSDAEGPVHLLHLAELRRHLADMGLDWRRCRPAEVIER
jgi:hypothetical protein